MKQNLGFADFVLACSAKHNRRLKNIEKFNKTVYWSRIDAILINYYIVGNSDEGARAYPSLLLFKCLLLQKKWWATNYYEDLDIKMSGQFQN